MRHTWNAVLRTSYHACPVNPSRAGLSTAGPSAPCSQESRALPTLPYASLRQKSCPGTASAAPVSREAGLARRERRALSGPDVRSGQQSQRACPATRERSGPELARDLRRCLRRSASQALAPESYCLVTDATPAAAANARSCFRARRSPEAPPHAPRKPVSP